MNEAETSFDRKIRILLLWVAGAVLAIGLPGALGVELSHVGDAGWGNPSRGFEYDTFGRHFLQYSIYGLFGWSGPFALLLLAMRTKATARPSYILLGALVALFGMGFMIAAVGEGSLLIVFALAGGGVAGSFIYSHRNRS